MTDGSQLKLKVVELGSFAAVPYCTRLLADFGAEVIKIEEPDGGDIARKRGPFLHDAPNPEASGLFLYANSGKLGVTLDIHTTDGQKIFRQLIADADVLVEDQPVGLLKELGLDYAALKQINPKLIMVSITPFGQTGPYRDYKAYHLNLYHGCGSGYMLPMNSTNFDREPVRGPGFAGEFDSGMSAALAIMAAVYWRRQSGQGQYIDISKQEALMHLERSQLRRFIDTGKSPNRTGMGRLLEALVECKDGNFVILILSSEKQWQGLFEAMGRPSWGLEEPFNTQAGRSAHYFELKARLETWAKNNTAQDVFELVQRFKSACAPAYTAETFFHSPQIVAREYLIEIDHPVAGKLQYPGLPYKFSDMPDQTLRPAPLLGQHNEEVFCNNLKYTKQELVQLKQAGII